MESFICFNSSCTAVFSSPFPCFTVDLTVFAAWRKVQGRLLSSPQRMEQLSLHAALASVCPHHVWDFSSIATSPSTTDLYHRHSETRITKVLLTVSPLFCNYFYPIFSIRNPKTKFSDFSFSLRPLSFPFHEKCFLLGFLPSLASLQPPSCPFLCPPISIFSLSS